MKNKNCKGDWSRKGHEEFVYFLYMCGKKDRAFFDDPEKNGSTEDYARLMVIALGFGFNKMFLKILAKSNNDKELFQCLDQSLADTRTVLRWFDDFVEKIPIPEFKQLAMEAWGNKRGEIEKRGFRKSDLFT